MGAIRDLVLIGLVLFGAIAASNVPRFVQEYEQRLGGALQEATRQLDEFKAVAEREGVPFRDYIRRLTGTGDGVIVNTGRTIEALVIRVERLGTHARAVEDAPRLVKPLLVLRDGEADLFDATWQKFQPGLTLDPLFALIGVALGWAVTAFFTVLASFLLRRRLT